jgi:hypothetical protein
VLKLIRLSGLMGRFVSLDSVFETLVQVGLLLHPSSELHLQQGRGALVSASLPLLHEFRPHLFHDLSFEPRMRLLSSVQSGSNLSGNALLRCLEQLVVRDKGNPL